MKSRSVRLGIVVALLGASPLVPGGVPPASADHIAQPPLDPNLIDYTPIGYYGPADEWNLPAGVTGSATIPDPRNGPPPLNDPNPSGKWVAYDTNVWESLSLPSRHPGDDCQTLPPELQEERHCQAGDLDDDNDLQPGGSGPTGYAGPNGFSAVHGTCPASSNPTFGPWGECFNNQLEYLDHYERSMEAMLADFGGVVHRYPFISPGDGERGTTLAAAGGQAYNIGAVVPGTDHPEETVLVSGHYDFTDSGPAAAWDSAEGHTEVMRMAYIMSDYWRKTGTRPSATVKFIPWDSEESGTHGSADYARNNIVPGQEDKVRAYFNVDPCAGAYPAYKDHNFAQRVQEVMQLSNPRNFPEDNDDLSNDPNDRIEAFNAKAEIVVDEVFDYLDDTITSPRGEEPIFVSDAEAAAGENGGSSHRNMIETAVGGLALFTSDYRNFEPLGIPIFNLFPDYFGPHADGEPGSLEGLSILHTPNDNLTRINKLTSTLTSPGNAPDPTGKFASEGWAKGMEMCSQIEAWYMLQPEMVGARTATNDVVAYYEALPNEAIINQSITFDAGGSYQYADPATRALVPERDLLYTWDFGDGTTGAGKSVEHSYAEIGRYDSVLTVTNTTTGKKDTLSIPITVVGSNFTPPDLKPIDEADAADGTFGLNWEFTADREGFDHFSVQQSTNLSTLLFDDAEKTIEETWVVSPPTSPKIEPWQKSNSDTPKWLGNKSHSGDASLWTGVTPDESNPPPTNAQSVLTAKNAIRVPNTTAVELQYWSLFKNESDDRGRLELALEDGDPNTEPDWQTIDIVGGPNDTFVPGETNAEDPELQLRRADLGAFAGRTIRLRFVYAPGASAPVLSQPAGWYVDDVRVQAGTFKEIGTTAEKNFLVRNRARGTYAYRILGIYRDGVPTAASNTESVTVPKRPKCRGHENASGNHIVGTRRADTLRGTPGRDVICGFGDDDTIFGYGGNDLLIGGAGSDFITGGAGADRVKGGRGNDDLRGGRGADVMIGGRGHDNLGGWLGNDSLSGRRGNDTLRGHSGHDRLSGGAGNDALRGGSGIDRCRGGPGRDSSRGCEGAGQ